MTVLAMSHGELSRFDTLMRVARLGVQDRLSLRCRRPVGDGLRGLKDRRVPMRIALAGYWPVGFGLSFAPGLQPSLAGVGVWIGLAAGLWWSPARCCGAGTRASGWSCSRPESARHRRKFFRAESP